jgi:outer membrane usher protein
MNPRRRQGMFGVARPLARIVAMVACLAAAAALAGEGRPLQLEVSINGTKTGLLGAFTQLPDERLAVRRGELIELGINPPDAGKPDDEIVIDTAFGGKFTYDEPTQSIAIDLLDKQRVARAFDAIGEAASALPARADWGSVLNYTLFGSGTSGPEKHMAFSGASASLDARIFGPYGTLSQTAILGTTTARDLTALRLDTTFAYSDPRSLITYRGGDAITGGLAWTRPIRFGGVQVQRNFALRSDLVTAPLPTFSGSAAVPSTLDVYLNNTKTYTQDVPPGPFQVNNLPLISGGQARLVLRDAAGREVETTLPFYTSPRLLREGLTYFSAEAGFPRIRYGTESDSYIERAFAAASVRRGVFDWLTVEGHAEAGGGLYNGGIGALIRTANMGVLSLAASASTVSAQTGFQAYGSFETNIFGLTINASSTRTFGAYNDLASTTAPIANTFAALHPTLAASTAPPKALDRISVGMRLPDLSSLGLSFVHLETAAGDTSNLFSAAWSRRIFANSQIFVTAFMDVKQQDNYGVFGGISVPFGDKASVSVGATSSATGTSITADASRPLSSQIGSYGWRVRESEGASSFRSAAGSYRTSGAAVQAGIEQSGRTIRTMAQAEGAIAFIGNSVFFSNRIDDAFAIVDAGAPGVPVFYENRPYGETDKNGQLLVPNLRAYSANRISIDPKGLPVNTEIEKTDDVVAPADRSGVVVRFKTKTAVQSAVVIFAGADGKPIHVGSGGRLDGADGEDGEFIVGYDGRAFIKNLKSSNTAVLTTDAGECRASFDYAPAGDRQIVIGPVPCS